MPIGDVFVGDSGCDVEHDDATLAVNVVPVAEATELLLPCGIPDIELNWTEVLTHHQPAEPNPALQQDTYC